MWRQCKPYHFLLFVLMFLKHRQTQRTASNDDEKKKHTHTHPSNQQPSTRRDENKNSREKRNTPFRADSYVVYSAGFTYFIQWKHHLILGAQCARHVTFVWLSVFATFQSAFHKHLKTHKSMRRWSDQIIWTKSKQTKIQNDPANSDNNIIWRIVWTVCFSVLQIYEIK